jgi:hypothetical protein
MPADINAVTPFMKEVYRGKIREMLNQEIVALKRITRSGAGVTNETGGKYVTFPIHTRRNAGVGSRLEGEPLPVPGQQNHAAARVGLKYAYGGIQLTGQAISLTDTDAKAFAKVLDTEINGLKNDVKKDMNRQVYGTGSGAVGVTRTVVTALNVITVVDARLFQIGMIVDLITLPATVAAVARTVTAIDLTAGANTVTLSGAALTTTVGQILVRTGSGPHPTAGNREITGLAAIISNTGILYNLDPAIEPEWTSEVASNGGTNRALSEGLMTQMVDRIRTRGTGQTSVIFQSLGVRRSYANLLMQTRSTVNTQDFTGGFKGLAFVTDGEAGEIPVISDVDAPLNTQYFVDESSLTFYRDKEWDWIDRDGSMWKQVRDAAGDYDAYYARLVEYHELGCDRRSANGRINDITES